MSLTSVHSGKSDDSQNLALVYLNGITGKFKVISNNSAPPCNKRDLVAEHVDKNEFIAHKVP